MLAGAAIPTDLFRTACGRFATGVAIATVGDPDAARWGLTVNSFSSVSLDPPLILFSIDLGATSHEAFVQSDMFAVNILSADQRDLSDRFSFVSDADRFEGVALAQGSPEDPPLLAGCLAHLVCSLETTVPGGDHTILIGRVRRIDLSDDPAARPLLYYRGGYARLTD